MEDVEEGTGRCGIWEGARRRNGGRTRDEINAKPRAEVLSPNLGPRVQPPARLGVLVDEVERDQDVEDEEQIDDTCVMGRGMCVCGRGGRARGEGGGGQYMSRGGYAPRRHDTLGRCQNAAQEVHAHEVHACAGGACTRRRCGQEAPGQPRSHPYTWPREPQARGGRDDNGGHARLTMKRGVTQGPSVR